MPSIVSPDPGDFDPGTHNGHHPDLIAGELLIADHRAYEGPLDLTPEFVAEQSAILDEELGAFLADQSHLLPGFETLAWTDLRMCPAWCVYRDSEVHADAFDSDPDNAPHRSAEHTVRTTNGGESIDHQGRAEVTVQLEQDRHHGTGPTIVLSMVVNGIEQYTWLTPPEAHAVHHAVAFLVTEANA